MSTAESFASTFDIGVTDFRSYDLVIDCRDFDAFMLDCIPGSLHLEVFTPDDAAAIRMAYRDSPCDVNVIAESLAKKNVRAWLANHDGLIRSCNTALLYGAEGDGDGRTGVAKEMLKAYGIRVDVLVGGYADYRQWVDAAIERLPQFFDFRLICGTALQERGLLIGAIAAQGGQVLDLERIVNECEAVGQSSSGLKSRLVDTMRRMDSSKPVWVEFVGSDAVRAKLPPEVLAAVDAPRQVCLVSAAPSARLNVMKTQYSSLLHQPKALVEMLAQSVEGMRSELVACLREMAASMEADKILERLLKEHFDWNYARALDALRLNMRSVSQLQINNLSTAGLALAARAMMSCCED